MLSRQIRLFAVAMAALAFILSPGDPAWAAPTEDPDIEVLSVEKIWDAAPHNAFTGLARFKGDWYVAFREGPTHGVHYSGSLRVLRLNEDSGEWESVALMEDEDSDLRDADLTVSSDGQELMLLGVRAFNDRDINHQPVVWFTPDGQHWTQRIEVGEPNLWIWSATAHNGQYYGVGYNTTDRNPGHVRLYSSENGREWDTLVSDLGERDYPNETSIVFGPDDTAYMLLRRGGPSSIGTAQPPYTDWQFERMGVYTGGPEMMMLDDGRLLATVRLVDSVTNSGSETWLCWIDPDDASLTPAKRLPSGGDNSYAGMVEHDGVIWISYYSSHEGRTSIYLAKVRVND